MRIWRFCFEIFFLVAGLFILSSALHMKQLNRYFLVCLWAKHKDPGSLRANMVVTHLMLPVTAQGTDPISVHGLLCYFTYFTGMGSAGVIVREDLAR